MTERPLVLAIVGPTAAGKTGVALAVARAVAGEIISADAVSVYRGFDIGTAKPTAQEQAAAPHHLIDVAGPGEDFNAARFAELAGRAIEAIIGRAKRPIVAGGSGLYVKALLHGLFQAPPVDADLRRQLTDEAEADRAGFHDRLAEIDPRAAKRIAVNDVVRMVRAMEIYRQTGQTLTELTDRHRFRESAYQSLKLGLAVDRQVLHRRIELRAEAMLAQGLIEETDALLRAGVSPDSRPMNSIGYKEARAVLAGEMDLDRARELIIRDTRRLAKRQMTWFRGDSDIIWLPADDPARFVERARSFWEI